MEKVLRDFFHGLVAAVVVTGPIPDRMLRLMENAIRWQREPAGDAGGAAVPTAAATGAG